MQLFPILGLSFLIEWCQFYWKDEFFFLHWPRWVQSLVLAAAILAIFLTSSITLPEPFIYQGF